MTMDPRIGFFGTFDRQTLSDRLAPRILAHELARRLDGARFRTFAPTSHSSWWDGGQPAEALGPWSPERTRELTDQLDCLVVRAGEALEQAAEADSDDGPDARRARFLVEGLGSENAERCPTVWLTHDPESAKRLKASDVVGEVDIVADLAVLVPRLFSKRLLRKRLQYQRLMGWYPPGDRVLAVQGDEHLAKVAPVVAETLSKVLEAEPDLALVVLETDGWRNDTAFATALESALPVTQYRLPPTTSVEDLVSAISACAVFIGCSVAAHAVALAFDRPAIGLDLVGSTPIEEMLELGEGSVRVVHDAEALSDALDGALAGHAPSHHQTALAIHRLDSSLDGIAKLADESAKARARAETGDDRDRLRRRLAELEARLAVVEAAYEVRGQRLVAERVADADAIWKIQHEKRESVARLEAKRAEVEAIRVTLERALDDEQLAHAATRAELARTRATRTFRYTAGARRVYGAMRRRLR